MPMPPPPVHPNIALFISLLTMQLEAVGMKKMQESQLVAYQIWNVGMSEPERSAILKAQQRGKKVTLIMETLASIPLERLAKYPEEAEVAGMARIGGVSMEYKKYFQEYYKSVLGWFTWEYDLIFKDDTLKKRIFSSLKNPVLQDGDEMIFMEIMMSGEIRDLSTIQPFMRAYQALINHTFYEYQGKIFSHFSFDLAKHYYEYSGNRHVDMGDFFARITEGYLHIEQFFQCHRKQSEKYREEMRQRCKKLGIEDNNLLPGITEYHPEYAPILRHTYDWIVRMLPERISTSRPVEIFAIVVYALHYLYEEVGTQFLPKKFPLIYETELRSYVEDMIQKKLVASAKEKARFGLEAFMYVNSYTDHSFFFPVIKNQKEDEKLALSWEKLRDKFSTYFE